MSKKPTQLRKALDESHRQSARPAEPGFPRRALEQLQHFQRARLASTYADLAEQARYREAVTFFLEELYGGRDAQQRDRQLDGALPVMERALPRRMKDALADAFRLQAMSLELDIALVEAMDRTGVTELDPVRYAQIYSEVPQIQRERQIALIHKLALELDRVVHLPLVLGLVVAMRRPARKAGFGPLQSFLEKGLRAFRSMGSARAFADTIRDRETRIMIRLYRGDRQPFDLENQTSQPK